MVSRLLSPIEVLRYLSFGASFYIDVRNRMEQERIQLARERPEFVIRMETPD